MLQRLPESKAPPAGVPEPTALTRSFRTFRAQLVEEGWWQRSAWSEARTLAPCLLLFVLGTLVARRHALLATVLLALGSTASGWVAHDYVHGRGRYEPWKRMSESVEQIESVGSTEGVSEIWNCA